MDEDLFKQAVNIAHSNFWLADDLQVVENARKALSERSPKEDLLAYYVAEVCLQAVRFESQLE